MAIVSPVAGTTTDPVRKSMELLPLGPVVMIDTPGLDDEGEVGSLRVGRALRELNRADIAVLVVDAAAGMADEDRALLKRFEQKELPHLTVFNKCDLRAISCGEGELAVSARTGEGVEALKEALGHLVENGSERKLLGDLLEAGDLVLLVAPIDASAPRGRLILPQVRAIRDILDAHAACAVVQPQELPRSLQRRAGRASFITDSQAFGTVKGMGSRGRAADGRFPYSSPASRACWKAPCAGRRPFPRCGTATRCLSARAARITASARTSAR